MDALIEDNPSFKSNDYKISFAYKIKIVESSEQNDMNYPSLVLKNKNEDVLKTLPYSTDMFSTLENVNFNDSTDYFDLTFTSKEDVKWVLDIEAISLQFFALKK